MKLYSNIAAFFLSIHVLSAQAVDPADLPYEKRITMSRINDVYIPKNTDDALMELYKLSEQQARDRMKTTSEDTIASKLHFGLGRWMLVNWYLEQGSRLSHYYKLNGVTYPDDMVDLLLRALYRKVTDKPVDEQALLKSYVDKRKKEMEEEKAKRPSKTIKRPRIKKHLE